jgi:surface polysaccharide O-acyltransferase-like enzyme
MTAAAFYLLRAANGRIPEGLAKLVRALSGASLGIYLIHVIVLDLFDRFLGPAFPWLQNGLTLFVMPAVALVAFAVCTAVVLAMQKIPVLKYSVPS